MKSIVILCPTRGRPSRFAAMVRTAYEMASVPGLISVCAYLDQDEPEMAEYKALRADFSRLYLHIGPRITNPQTYNVLAGLSRSDIIFTGADDVLFRTGAWDLAVRRALSHFHDGVGIACPMDGAEDRKGKRCIQWFCDRRTVDALGCVMPTQYEHFFADTHVGDVAERSGRLVWMHDVLIEHMHPNHKKAKRDATYDYKRKGALAGMSDRDESRFAELEPERITTANRILKGA